MNYVILNGVKSTTIKGLLIQSLPPVSKPLLRTEIEEIDGRDGDIVTKLGYSAYDKEMTIGLYGKYDVDDVISYFDSQGIVTFSNEPDKFYKYEIIEQIDFERLIRYRTATVIFHVQPFKFSTIEQEFTKTMQLLNMSDYLASKSGLTISANGSEINVSGESTSAVEVYLPIGPATLGAGSYTLTAYASGTNANRCSVRLIGSVPSDADTFGGTYLPMQNNSIKSMGAALTQSKTFNYVWLYITAGTMDFTINLALTNDGVNSFTLLNTGNIYSKPQMTLSGIGNIEISLNGQDSFLIQFTGSDEITIDVAQMEAYSGSVLKNRLVTGDYNDFQMKVGSNTVQWTGIITKIELLNYSRWI